MPDESIDRGTDGRTELRVHGVSGTPPASILGRFPLLRQVEPVEEDGPAGFWRRWYPGGRSGDLTARAAGGPRLEAYSWGGLTSGSAGRAAWLLLLPFMLANLATYMLPASPPGQLRLTARAAVLLLRLFGLTLTLTMLLTAVQVAVDVVGWQCGQLTRCTSSSGLLGPLGSGWLSSPGRRVVVTALVPLAVVLLLGVLGRQLPRTTSPEPVEDATPTAADQPLTWAETWKGNPGMPVLRTLHIAAAAAVLAVLVAWPATSLVATGAARALGFLVCGAALVTLLVASVLVAGEDVAGRERRAGKRSPAARALRWLALGLLAVAAILSAAPGADGWDPAGRLPGLRPSIYVNFATQLVLLLALAAVVLVQRPWEQGRGGFRVALLGLGAPAVAALAWVVAGGFSAGLTFRVAELLGHSVLSARAAQAELAARAAVAGDQDAPFAARLAAATAEAPLVVPPPFAWAGAATAVVLLGVLVALVYLGLTMWLRLPRLDGAVRRDYAATAGTGVRAVSQARALASLTEGAGLALGAVVGACLVALGVGLVLYLRPDGWTLVQRPPWSTLTSIGTWAMGAFALGLVVLAYNSYRRPALRRTVGILWDVGSFWPRATHPLAPPSYGERAVPELVERVRALTAQQSGRVVLSGHSQGSVIVAAAVLLLRPDTVERVAVLTHGSPLRRLYARFFPAYLDEATLRLVRERIGDRWRNLHRDTDPIGSWVLDDLPPGEHGAVDWRLLDPRQLGGRVEGHSDYWSDPAYDEAARELLGELSAPRAAAPPPPPPST